MLITLTGASGVGKTSMFKRALEAVPNVRFLHSLTTRAKRDSDLPGEYSTFTEEAWRTRLERGELAWHIHFAGQYYGTLRSDVRAALESPHPHLAAIVPDIIPKLHQLAELFGMKSRLTSLYIFSPPKDMLRERMAGRGETPDKIEERLKTSAGWDMAAKREKCYSAFIRDRNDLDEKFSALRSHLTLR